MPNDTNNSLVITYGTTELDFATLPQASVVAMLRRGVSHLLGSEMASKVTSYFDPENEVEGKLEDTPENRAAKKAEFQAEAIAKLKAGTIGVSTRGPAVDPITVIQRRLAKNEVSAILKANGLAWPKKAEDVVTMADGSTFTGAQLIDRRLSHADHGPRIVTEAKKIAAEQAKKAKKAEDMAAAEGLAGL